MREKDSRERAHACCCGSLSRSKFGLHGLSPAAIWGRVPSFSEAISQSEHKAETSFEGNISENRRGELHVLFVTNVYAGPGFYKVL